MTAIAQVAACSRSAAWIGRIGAFLRQLGPYAAIEILLPGGTLLALLFWLYRRSVHGRQVQTNALTGWAQSAGIEQTFPLSAALKE